MITLATDDTSEWAGTFGSTIVALATDLLSDGPVPIRVTYDNGYEDDRNPGTVEVTLTGVIHRPGGVSLDFGKPYDEAGIPDLGIEYIERIEVP